jgi:hypothetical protein
MKRLLIGISLLLLQCSLNPLWAQNDDIEITDSTSTGWGDGGGGGLNPLQPDGPVTSLTISQTSATLEGGKFIQLVAKVNVDAGNKNILWSSANSAIASVNSYGKVRGMSKGVTTITATAAGNTSLKATCQVTVTSDYTGILLPDAGFEFFYNATDYDETTQSIPNHENANLKASLQLTENIPAFVDGELLRITERCEGYINRWEKGSRESGAYFYREGADCMTIVAKVAPKKNNNASDFICNRGDDYNYMWRIGSDLNSSFLHTGTAWEDGSRALLLPSEEPQVLAVRVDGVNNYILLQNLTTGESLRVDNVNWGGGNNVFKLFYNDGGEFFLGDFYWVYFSFELLSDDQMDYFKEYLKGDANNDGSVDIADAVCIVNHIVGKTNAKFDEAAADANNDKVVDIADAVHIVNYVVGKINALAPKFDGNLPDPQ